MREVTGEKSKSIIKNNKEHCYVELILFNRYSALVSWVT